MNFHNAWLVFKKDWLEIKRNWQVLMPIIIVPIIISVAFPLIIGSIGNMPTTDVAGNQDFDALIPNLPLDVQNMLANLSPNLSTVYILLVYFFTPFFLIIPVMASSVIGSDSFAGERERKTIEALLATPISDSELLLGKILVSFIPAMAVTFVAYGIYMTIVDIMTFGMFGGLLLLPNVTWLIMMFGVTPIIALCSIGLTVMVSSKVKGFKEAQQISVVLLVPVIGLMIAQMLGMLFLGPLMLVALIGIFAAVDVAIYYLSVKIFQREEILSKQ
ncbi:MAG: ABC transporter permease subunit [Candidatus Bathyarchaeota archaeon]|nr:ABC transporter permease subunit [Candidatus Termiticorpusculum sp.]